MIMTSPVEVPDFKTKQNAALEAAFAKYVELSCMVSEVKEPVSIDSLVEVVKAMYNTFSKKGYNLDRGTHSFAIDGRIYEDTARFGHSEPIYTLYNCISLDYYKGDLNRIAEDLTMAEYQLRGGCLETYIPHLISVIKEQIEERVMGGMA